MIRVLLKIIVCAVVALALLIGLVLICPTLKNQ